ncbi:MAG: FUSC family protein [Vulcanimicrobiaceae bacterium]
MNGALPVARRIWHQATDIDASGVKLRFAVRCTVGVALPLLGAALAGQPLDGVAAAIGALSTGFASRQGVYRTRAAAMLLTAFGMSVSAFVGNLTGGNLVANVAVSGLWGLGFGILAALGSTATVVGLNSCVALAVFGQFRSSPEEAAIQAGFVFCGGLLQTLLLVLVWPLQRFNVERAILAKAYRALAEYAGAQESSKLKVPDLQTLTATLADPQPFARRGEIAVFQSLLDETERIRARLAALHFDRLGLERRGKSEAVTALDAIGNDAHDVLGEIAGALEKAEAPPRSPERRKRIEARVARLEREGEVQTADDARALLGQLRAVARLAEIPAGGEGSAGTRRVAWLFRRTVLVDGLQTLRANVSLDSAYAQHGIRLGTTLALAAAASHVFPLGRGYWAALTVVLVLRPDFTTTFARGTARVLGTLLGAILASAVAALLHPSQFSDLVLAVFFAGAGYALFDVSYAVYTTTVTAYVVFLLAFGGLPEHMAVLDRVEATLLGGALALIAYVIWPTWERELVPEQLARLLERQRAYLKLVFDAYLEPAKRDDRTIAAAQRATWLARTNAEASVDRMLAEPVHANVLSARATLGVLAASRRMGLALLTLKARIAEKPVAQPPELAQLADALDRALELLTSALRERRAPPELPPLRRIQLALVESLGAGESGEDAGLSAQTDVLVDATNTIADLLRKRAAGVAAAVRRRARGSQPRGTTV